MKAFCINIYVTTFLLVFYVYFTSTGSLFLLYANEKCVFLVVRVRNNPPARPSARKKAAPCLTRRVERGDPSVTAEPRLGEQGGRHLSGPFLDSLLSPHKGPHAHTHLNCSRQIPRPLPAPPHLAPPSQEPSLMRHVGAVGGNGSFHFCNS